MNDTAVEWQIQSSRNGLDWQPRGPRVEGEPSLSMVELDYWFDDQNAALVAGQHLRNTLTWSEVRLVGRDEAGSIVHTEPVL